jgi:hypothetical protein
MEMEYQMSERLPPPPYFYIHPNDWNNAQFREAALYQLQEGYLVKFSAVIITAPMPKPSKVVWIRGKGLIE